MSLTEEILTILSDYSGGYRLMRRKALGFTFDSAKNSRPKKDEYLRVVLTRLKNRDLIENKNHIWRITKKGRGYLKKINKFRHFQIDKHDKRQDKEKMIIAFDIPEKKKIYRNWLRSELVNLDFKPIQKSVWLGPAPLPESFVSYLSEINIFSYLKFFKVRKEDLLDL